MKPERTAGGMAPQQQRRQQMPAPVAQKQSPEEGTETAMTAPASTIPVIIDALNESIIALKVEIHRTTDTNQRRELEGHANKLREQIVALGGEPVYADETVEEGLQKLGQRRTREEPQGGQQGGMPGMQGMPGMPGGEQGGMMGGVPGLGALGPGGGMPQMQPEQQIQTQGYIAEPLMRDIGQQLGVDVGWDPQQSRVTVGHQTFGVGEVPHTRYDPATERHYVTDQRKFQQEFAPPTTPTFVPEEGFQAEDEDGFSAMLKSLATEGLDVGPPPAPILNAEYVNQLLGQYGLHPRSDAEIQAHAKAIVERQAWGQTQIIERELERFGREHPPEFARAQEQIMNAAKGMAAEHQEEFANRGMYYSSIMGNAMGELDAKAMDIVSDIAQDAASYVLELRADIRDIAQWAVLEEEVVRRQLEQEERALSERLVNLQVQVAQHSDQYALDSWYRHESLQLQSSQVQLQAIELQMQEAERAGQHLAMAYMADHPMVQDNLIRMGISPEMFANMPMEQRAGLVSNTVQFAGIEQEMRMNELNMQATMADMRLADQKFGLEVRKVDIHEFQWGEEFEEGVAQFWATFGLKEKELDHVISIDNQRLQLDRQIAGDVSARGWASVGLQRERLSIEREMEQYNRLLHERALGKEEGDRVSMLHNSGLGHVSNFLDTGNRAHIEAAQGSLYELFQSGADGYARSLQGIIRTALQPAPGAAAEEPFIRWEGPGPNPLTAYDPYPGR